MKLRTWVIIAAIFGLFFWKGFLVTLGAVIGAVGIWTIWCVCWDNHREKCRRKVCQPDTPVRDLLRPEPTRVHHVESGTGPHSHSAPRSTIGYGLLRIGEPAKLVEKVPEPCKLPPIPPPPPSPPATVEEVKKPEPLSPEMEAKVADVRRRLLAGKCGKPRKRCRVVKRRKRTKPALRRTVLGINTLKPGQTCSVSGQYRNSKTRKQCTVSRGEQMPPCRFKGTTWRLTDATRHKKKR